MSQTDLQQFDILLCIGNKVDLLAGHPAHVEYRRRLLKLDVSSGALIPELDYGISESEGTSLLGEEDSSWEIKRSCMDWCIEHNIEFIEACGSNTEFDNCKACFFVLHVIFILFFYLRCKFICLALKR